MNRFSRAGLLRAAVVAAIFIVAFMILTPLNPGLPGNSLDASWVTGLNAAIARGMSFGRHIDITFGPYAFVYTMQFDPALDRLMFLSASFLAISYALGAIVISRRAKWYHALAFFLLLPLSHDVALFALPLIAASVLSDEAFASKKWTKEKALAALAMTFLFTSVGFEPLIKGSLIVPCGATIAFAIVYLILKRRFALAAIAAVLPPVSCVVAWRVSGQILSDLPLFLKNMIPITAGYSEAMAVRGPTKEILLYLALAIIAQICLWYSFGRGGKQLKEFLFLSAASSVVFFLCFKGAFVRHDTHARLASGAMIFSALILSPRFSKKIGLFFLAASLLSANEIDMHYMARSPGQLVRNVEQDWLRSVAGATRRLFDYDSIGRDFDAAEKQIRAEYSIPKLPGTVDIYSYHQSYVLASPNVWNPRPIFQSYTVYTPELIRMNERHLREANAPDFIFFRLETIDGRIPSLDDGLSWPAIFDDYRLIGFDRDMARLQRREDPSPASRYEDLGTVDMEMTSAIRVPESTRPVFAEIDCELTALGKLQSLLFKPPSLQIEVALRDGEKLSFRTSSNMMKTGLFISPLIRTTEQFARLAHSDLAHLEPFKVDRFSIATSGDKSIAWNDVCKVHFQGYFARATASN